ncbi:NUDIX domain-containing protein [Nocardiopsis sp. NPDC055551]|uniref:NUDIX domain-containing protein n=1 Tax=Nocardiopsis sp. NPDC006832 TaxID=3157188 RepID=UPI0033F20B99
MVRDKALCCVAREGHLLVFRHVDHAPRMWVFRSPRGGSAGGGPRGGGVARGLREETGLDGLRVVRPLGVVEYELTPTGSRSSAAMSSNRRWTARSRNVGPRPRRTTEWANPSGSSAFGFPSPPRTCGGPARGR